jgi:hypothetical protein
MKYTDEISKALEPVEVDGRVALCCGLTVTLYFEDGWTQRQRRALLDVVNEYLGWAGPRLRWWFTEGRRFSKVASLQSTDMSRYLLSPKYEQPDSDLKWSFMWHGGVHKEDSSPVRFEALGASRMECELHGGLSFVRASFPLGSDLQALHQTTVRWATLFQAVHGYGGIAMLASPDDELASVSEGLFVARGERFPGLDVDYPVDHALWTRAGIKGGSWLTVLGDAYVARLGGVENLRQALGPPFSVTPYSGGAVIRSGEAPEIGDRNRQVPTPLLVTLAKVLRPIRVSSHPGVRISPEGYGTEEFERWLARFDQP